jgi:hypothetical protein
MDEELVMGESPIATPNPSFFRFRTPTTITDTHRTHDVPMPKVSFFFDVRNAVVGTTTGFGMFEYVGDAMPPDWKVGVRAGISSKYRRFGNQAVHIYIYRVVPLHDCDRDDECRDDEGAYSYVGKQEAPLIIGTE